MYNDKDIDRAVMLREELGNPFSSTRILEKVIAKSRTLRDVTREASALEQLVINCQLAAELKGDRDAIPRMVELCLHGLSLTAPARGRRVDQKLGAKHRIFHYRLGLAYFLANRYKLAHKYLLRAYNLSDKRSIQRAEFAGKLARIKPYLALEEANRLLAEAFRLNPKELGQDGPANSWPQWNRACGLAIDAAYVMSMFGQKSLAQMALRQATATAKNLKNIAEKPLRYEQVKRAEAEIKSM